MPKTAYGSPKIGSSDEEYLEKHIERLRPLLPGRHLPILSKFMPIPPHLLRVYDPSTGQARSGKRLLDGAQTDLPLSPLGR